MFRRARRMQGGNEEIAFFSRVGMMTEMSWEVDEEVNRDKNGEDDGMNLDTMYM